MPDDVPGDGVYTFVGDLDTAFERARATAGEKDVSVMGRHVRQLFRTGRVDEISVPSSRCFGSGTRMFDEAVDEHVTLEVVVVQPASLATHIRYRVAR